jgi:hypothetical protein
MDSPENPRATIAIHAPARAFAVGTQTALARLGYHLVPAETAEHDDNLSRLSIRIVDDRQLEQVPLESNGQAIPIILLTGHRGPLASDARAVGIVRRRARLNEVFALLQRALEARPRSVPRVPASLPARCTRDNHGWAGAIRSISEKGCLLHSTERLEPDRRVDLCFALPREGLLQIPAQPSYVDGKRAGLVFRDTSEQMRSAIAGYVTAQLTET